MIELKASTIGDMTTLEVSIKGTAEEIGLETAHIVTKLPERLLEECHPAFVIMQDKVKEISEEVRREFEEKIMMNLTEEHDVKCN